MSNSLEKKKLQAQLARQTANRLDLEVKLEELSGAIARIENEISINKKAEDSTREQLEKLEE